MINFLVGLFVIWFIYKLFLTVVDFVHGFYEGIEQESNRSVLRPYTGPMMRPIQEKKNKRLFDRR